MDSGGMSVFELIVRTSLAFLVLLLLTRIMGRKQITQLTFFDYVTGITIGSIAGVMAVDDSVSLQNGILSLAVYTAWIMIFNFLTLKSIPARKLIDAAPITVIHKGKILVENLGSRYYNIHDLLMQLRTQGVFNPDEVEIGVMEADGKLSILKKPQFQPVTLQDLNIMKQSMMAENVGKELIVDGKILYKNLTDERFNEVWLLQQLEARGISNVENVMLAMISPDGMLYIDKKNGASQVSISSDTQKRYD